MTRNPVLLLHGIDDTAASMALFGGYLSGRGWSVGGMSMTPGDGTLGLDLLAQGVAAGIDRQFPPDRPFDLVCFSMGCLVARYYLQRLGGLARVERLVMISAPHRGTLTAWFRHNPGSRQLRPGSAFLADLNRDVDGLRALKVTSIWTPFDLMILPASSSRLPFGRRILVPVLAHPLMLRSPRVLVAIERALGE